MGKIYAEMYVVKIENLKSNMLMLMDQLFHSHPIWIHEKENYKNTGKPPTMKFLNCFWIIKVKIY